MNTVLVLFLFAAAAIAHPGEKLATIEKKCADENGVTREQVRDAIMNPGKTQDPKVDCFFSCSFEELFKLKEIREEAKNSESCPALCDKEIKEAQAAAEAAGEKKCGNVKSLMECSHRNKCFQKFIETYFQKRPEA